MLTEEQIRIIENEVWGYVAYWCAVDADGFIAHFTGGDGPVPLVCLPLLEQYEAFAKALKEVSDTVLIDAEYGINDTWLSIAKRGLYSYDYLDNIAIYTLCATPVTPIHISEIPEVYHPLLNNLVLAEFIFSEIKPMDFEQLDIRTSWEHRWMPPSQQNTDPI